MRRTAIAVVALTATMLVAGCSGTGSGTDSRQAPGAMGPIAEAPQQGAPTRAGDTGSGGAAAEPGGDSSGGDSAAHAPLGSTALIKKASLQVEVSGSGSGSRSIPAAQRIGTQADAAGRIAVAAGGSVFADDRTSGDKASAQLTLKVPPDSLAAVLTRLAGLGKQLSRQSSTADVTSEVADVTSRVHSARDSLARLRTLYTRAGKVSDIISIERELAQREADLESLEARQRALTAQTSMATVELDLSASGSAPPAPKHHKGGFLGGLTRGWQAFTAAAGAVATGLGAALPFLVLALLVAVAGWRVRSRRTARHPTPAPAAE